MSQFISDKPVVKNIIEHCYAHGVRYVVVSPGSRNAPLIISFPASKKFTCYTIVDERSAAYFALGLARKIKQLVAIVCTSGTAALNYAPAMAEAFYQQIPLIAFTADRPPEFVDQADGQTIRQNGIFNNFVRYQCQLPFGELDDSDVWLTNRLLNEAFQNALGPVRGPIHINVPFREPLYGINNGDSLPSSRIVKRTAALSVSENVVSQLISEVDGYEKIMLIIGPSFPDAELTGLIRHMVAKGVVVITESLSNINESGTFGNTDRVLEGFPDQGGLFGPDVLITLDTPVLSKKLKQSLIKHSPKVHWHFSNQDVLVDTYQCLSHQIAGDAVKTLTSFIEGMKPLPTDYQGCWEKAKRDAGKRHEAFLDNVSWSDLKVFGKLSEFVPDNQELHLSNSTPVRYTQLFEWPDQLTFFSNRGTSGIDGCLSTAAGASVVGQQPVTLITGDQAFFYDSNGLWHKYLPASFRVIVINNGGGGIFRFIPGPSETSELEEFFEVRGNHQCRGIAETFGLQYYAAGNDNELMQILGHFWDEKGSPALLEIFTPGEENGEILRNYFKYLQSVR
jgi:2-succinyl-5-enolpyruvyl-6-hydroxy-3-cyclohexene-1-carboxylate synthase